MRPLENAVRFKVPRRVSGMEEIREWCYSLLLQIVFAMLTRKCILELCVVASLVMFSGRFRLESYPNIRPTVSLWRLEMSLVVRLTILL